ncbi:uncharacterized protein LOC103512253 [Diaphorina citri]|uniref:Uncharacterized protein LOC103512253 n=1 Tax=Diaphorina citri TaxID=121845 RepID=A0A1S3D6C7_DIACI|nr:uncharacterized protein LOC103512253 [Diaphorina citri]
MNFLLRVLVASTVVRLCSVIAGDYDFLSALFGLDYDSDSTESPDFGSVCIAAGSDMQGICTDPEWCEGMALGAGNCSESLCCCVGGGSCGANATSLVSYFTSPGYPRTFNGDPSQCTFQVCRFNASICKVRIDFLDTELAPPTNGKCKDDSFTADTLYGELCGK